MALSVNEIEARQQWLQERRKGIGGSDIAAICGLSKWRTPLQVYQEKLGEAPPSLETEAMEWGNRLEPVIRQAYADRTGRAVYKPEEPIIRHPEHEFLLASVDGFTACNRVVEIKTSRVSEGWGDEGTDEIPMDYFLQVQHYMLVTGFNLADVAVLIGGSDFRLYEVQAVKDLQASMIQRAQQFWEQVQKEIPPAPVSAAEMAAFYREVKPGSVLATEEHLALAQKLKEIRSQGKGIEEEEDRIKALLMEALGHQDEMVSPDGKPVLTWKKSKDSEKFDIEAFKTDYPNLYRQYVRTQEGSRRFLLKIK